ncbi:MAG TPA: hypothetical protein VG733_15520 [Chthoniobacteraceae bacterium]|nr:hypothetical protein [Chthoniobacteraceae bacterium]
MNSNAENADGKRRSHARSVAAAIAGVALVVLLVLPGFLAAWFSRMGSPGNNWSPFYSMDGIVVWDMQVKLGWRNYSAGQRAQCCILLPSCWAMDRSMAVRRFYGWEYHLAGGRDFHPPVVP